MSTSPDPDNLSAGTQVGCHRIVRRVGAGGFGTLYEVERGGKSYALKLARERLGDLDDAERARFANRTDREVASLKQLSHPNIVKVHALDCWPELETGHPYLVMDFVRGEELRSWCKARARSAVEVCTVFEKLARAIHYMHQRGVFHRDLKSENVIVREDGEPIVIDFGIARGRNSFPVTRHAAMVGTETHYAPEYVRHRESEAYQRGEEFHWSAATDLHAVGYMLYEALAGRAPFRGDDEQRLWRAIRDEVPPATSEVNPRSPKALDGVVARLLAKDPLDRQHSGHELAEDLRVVVERNGRRAEWMAPLARGSQTGTKRAAQLTDGDLGGIEELEQSPIAVAAATATPVRDAPLPETLTVERFVESSGERTASGSRDAPRSEEMVRDVERQLGTRHPLPRSSRRALLIGGIAVAVLLAGSAVLARTRRSASADGVAPQRIASTAALPSAGLPATEAAPHVVPMPQPPGPVSTKPSAADARAIDRELEARYGGRPTIAPDGSFVAVRTPGAATPAAAAAAPLTAAQEPPATEGRQRSPAPPSEEPAWLKRTSRPVPVVATAAPVQAKPLGIPTGAHIPARLLTTLDSRTVGSGPVEARLSRPFVVRGEVVLPAGTLVFGRASAIEGRFVVRFERLRLPDDREIELAAIAMDRDDGRPGLPASRRLQGTTRERAPDGLGTSIARGSAATVLNTVTGGLGHDLVREAGHVALQPREPGSSGSRDTLILDPGLVFDVWVERPL
jgi:serine/threonine protein kinase/type IV secretory pathway VirB10-like protein